MVLYHEPPGIAPDKDITRGTLVYFQSICDAFWYEGTFLKNGLYQANVLISDPSYPHGDTQFRGKKPDERITTRPLHLLILKNDQNDIDYWSK